MLLLGVLLACSLVTVLAVLVMCELQLREAQHSTRVVILPVDEQQRFDAIVAPLLADPEFGRVEF
jgi:hypothetical protein